MVVLLRLCPVPVLSLLSVLLLSRVACRLARYERMLTANSDEAEAGADFAIFSCQLHV